MKDVARFLALAINRSLYGVFNTTGNSISFRDFLDACKRVTNSDTTLTWIPQQFLHEHGLESDYVLHTFEGNTVAFDPISMSMDRVSTKRMSR